MSTLKWQGLGPKGQSATCSLRTAKMAAGLAVLFTFAVGQASATVAVSATPPIVNAYYGSAANQVSLSTLIANGATTHLNVVTYAFANSISDPYPTPQGSTRTYQGNPCTGAPSLINTADISKLKSQNPPVKIMISIGGQATTYDFEDWLLSDTPTNLAKTCVANLLGAYSPGTIDGIDVDWEYPSSATDEQNFNLLMAAFRQQLDAFANTNRLSQHLLLSASLAPEHTPNGWQYMDFAGATYQPAANTNVDFYNVQFYVYSDNGQPGTYSDGPIQSSTYYDSIYYGGSINDNIFGHSGSGYEYGADLGLEAGGMPASKLVLGAPYYGAHFTGATSGCQLIGPGTFAYDSPTYSQIMGYISTSPTAYSDTSCGTPPTNGVFTDSNGDAWAWNSTTDDWYEFDTPTTIGQKISFMNQNNLAGMFAWNLEDDTSTGTLTNSLPTPVSSYTDVSGSVSVTVPNGMTYNRIKHTASQTFVIKNTGGQIINGPIQLVVWELTQGLTPTGNAGTFMGSPYWMASANELLPGSSVSYTVTYSYTGSAPGAAVTTSVFSGAF